MFVTSSGFADLTRPLAKHKAARVFPLQSVAKSSLMRFIANSQNGTLPQNGTRPFKPPPFPYHARIS